MRHHHTRRTLLTSAVYASASLHPHAALAASPCRRCLGIYNETTTTSIPELVRLIGNERIMRADECLARGFVDEVR